MKDREILVTVKLVKGQWRKSLPTINVVFPLVDCKELRGKYQVSLKLQDAIEIGYRVLYWITICDISEEKGLKTAGVFLAKFDNRSLGIPIYQSYH